MSKLLLDTHIWLWWFLEPNRLSSQAVRLMEDTDTTLFLSAASSWEIAIKYALKKLRLPEPPGRYIPTRLERGAVTPLPIEHAHALRVAELPHHHRDPFDRLLIAQAQLEGATLATADPRFLLYEVDVLWAAAGEAPSEVHEGRRPWGRGRGGRRVSGRGALRRPAKKVRAPARSIRPKAVSATSPGRKAK
jgi:PIN domain nuclease of toxin-antitoxin system